MRLATRLAAGYALVIAVMAGMGAYQLALIDRLLATNRQLSQVSLTAVSSVLRLRRSFEQIRELTQKLYILRDPDYAAVLDGLREQAGQGVKLLAALDLTGAERLEVDRLARLWADYGQLAETDEAQALAGGSGEDGPMPYSLQSALAGLVLQLDEILRVGQVSIQARVDETSARVERARWVSLGATAAGVVGALLVSFLIGRSVVAPVRRLARGTHALARGDLSHRVEPAGGPELAALAADFNAMATRLEELDRVKRDFVSNVSHDLKAPLAAVQETLRLLLDGIPGAVSAQQERLLRLALGSADRLGVMIADLLDLARLDSGALRYRFAPHDLSELARSAVLDLEPLMRQKRLHLEANLPAALVVVECDGPLLVRVLENLLSNAVRFSPADAAISLAIRPAAAGEPPPPGTALAAGAEAVLVEIADAGPGVADADKERVFERFRGSGPGRGPGAGTGLGLAIARSVVEGHRGAIWLRDRPQGGTIATVLLPRRAAAD